MKMDEFASRDKLIEDNRNLRNKLTKSKEENMALKEKNTELEVEVKEIEEYYQDYFLIDSRLERAEKEILDLKEELALRRKVDGRPSRFNKEQKRNIRDQRMTGISINKIAEEYNCSTSTIHNLVKDIQLDLRKTSSEKQKNK